MTKNSELFNMNNSEFLLSIKYKIQDIECESNMIVTKNKLNKLYKLLSKRKNKYIICENFFIASKEYIGKEYTGLDILSKIVVNSNLNYIKEYKKKYGMENYINHHFIEDVFNRLDFFLDYESDE